MKEAIRLLGMLYSLIWVPATGMVIHVRSNCTLHLELCFV